MPHQCHSRTSCPSPSSSSSIPPTFILCTQCPSLIITFTFITILASLPAPSSYGRQHTSSAGQGRGQGLSLGHYLQFWVKFQAAYCYLLAALLWIASYRSSILVALILAQFNAAISLAFCFMQKNLSFLSSANVVDCQDYFLQTTGFPFKLLWTHLCVL